MKKEAADCGPTGSTHHRTVLGVRLSALVELVLFFAVALALDYLFFGGARYARMEPHPFWLIVLLISVQYGTGEGLLAALAATAALLVGNVPEQDLRQDWYSYLYQLCRLPVMWLFTALVLGELRMRQIRERDALRTDLAQTAQRERRITEAYRRLSQAKDKLEARVASQMSTALTIYQAAREIEKLEPSDVLKGMADVVRAVMKPEKFSIYLMKENALELVVFEGWSGNDRYARAFSSGSPLFHGVIGERRYPCAADKTDEKILLGEGLLAGPLLSRESGEVFGMLKVEELGFLRLNITSVQTFKAVCQWLGTAYSNARLHEAAQSDSITNRETQLFSHGFFRQYTAHLAELARRIGFDLSMIILRLDNETELTDGQRSLIPPALSKAIQISLRRTDLAFEHRRGSCEYAVVLPNTPQMNCAFVAEKLVKTLRACLGDEAGRARFSTSVHSLNRGTQGEALRICELVPRQVDFMVQLARRLGFDLAAIDMRLAHAEELPLEGRNALHGAVYSVFESLLPPDGSLVASYPAGSGYQILLFPMTTQEASAAILPLSQAVEAKVKTLGVQAHFTYAAQSLHARRESESAHV